MRPTHRGQLQPGGLKSVAVRGLGMHPTSYTGIYIYPFFFPQSIHKGPHTANRLQRKGLIFICTYIQLRLATLIDAESDFLADKQTKEKPKRDI